MVLGIDAEDREEGAGDRASPQQRRPRHPRGRGAHCVTAAPSQGEEGRRRLGM
jgi:hypothetical protein